MDPPVSVATAAGMRPAATAAADPPLDPPLMKSGCHGLRVPRPAWVLCRNAPAELVRSRQAHDDGARPPQAPDNLRVGGGHGAGECVRTVGSGQVRDVEQFLYRDRHAVQRPSPPAALEFRVGRRGGAAGTVGVDRDKRREVIIDWRRS